MSEFAIVWLSGFQRSPLCGERYLYLIHLLHYVEGHHKIPLDPLAHHSFLSPHHLRSLLRTANAKSKHGNPIQHFPRAGHAASAHFTP
jgi:hypothetical protein